MRESNKSQRKYKENSESIIGNNSMKFKDTSGKANRSYRNIYLGSHGPILGSKLLGAHASVQSGNLRKEHKYGV